MRSCRYTLTRILSCLSIVLVIALTLTTPLYASTGDITVSSAGSHLFDVTMRISPDGGSDVSQVDVVLPEYMADGLVSSTDDRCSHGALGQSIHCTGGSGDVSIYLTWDSRDIMERRYCERVVGEPQTVKPWIVRRTFRPTLTTYWLRSLTLSSLSGESGAWSDTHADMATDDSYIVLWGSGDLSDGTIEVVYDTYGGKSAKIGSLSSLRGGPLTLSVFNLTMRDIEAGPGSLTVCGVESLEDAWFDQTFETTVRHTSTGDVAETVDLPRVRYEYDSIQVLDDTQELIVTDTQGSQSDVSPTDTPPLTPTPTTNVYVQYSVTATPTIHSTSTPTQSSGTPTPTSPIGETPTDIRDQIHGAATVWTPTPVVIGSLTESGFIEPADRGTGSASVLGASTESRRDSGGWGRAGVIVGGMGVLIVVMWGVLRVLRAGSRRVPLGVLIILILMISPRQVSAAPQVLVKITSATSYYARAYQGSIDLVTYPPNFYFEGLKPGGRMTLSSTPDGTGRVSLGNGGFLTRRLVNWSSAVNSGLGSPSTANGHCDAAQDIPPTTLDPNLFTSPNTVYNVRITFQGYCPRSTPWLVSDVYLVYFPPEPTATPTATPTLTSTPTPSPTLVPPFLDLPWDYESDDLTFTEAALRMTSYFDHEYPTLSIGGVFDGEYVIGFKSSKQNASISYSSHDGYDYAKITKVSYGDDQLAAAGGIASYHYDRYSGHAIYIDHANGYQTRYYHMQEDGLIVSEPGQKRTVSSRQRIGKVGYSGNVSPAGVGGAHIHFMVIYDKDHDGGFDDNIPDGLVDPYGWQGEGDDPWAVLQFEYAGQLRTGMPSRYLWTHPVSQASTSVGSEGAQVHNERVTLSVPPLTIPDLLQFIIRSAPRTPLNEDTESVGSTADITAVDGGGIAVKRFTQPVSVSFTYSEDDERLYDTGNMSIYSSPDGAIWHKEQTLIDHDARTATAMVDHLTLFALMGQRRDTIPPQTTSNLTGKGTGVYYHSDVIVSLLAEDETGVDYTLYQIDDREWQGYSEPLTVIPEGSHTVRYFSVDTSGNVEDVQTMGFTIDRTLPEIEMHYDMVTQGMVFATDADATLDVSSEGVVTAQDRADNVREIQYEERVDGDWVTVEIQGDVRGLSVISTAVRGVRGSEEDLRGRYEYFQSGDTSVRKIPHSDGRLSVGPDGTIVRDTARAPLHIRAVDDTLAVDD